MFREKRVIKKEAFSIDDDNMGLDLSGLDKALKAKEGQKPQSEKTVSKEDLKIEARNKVVDAHTALTEQSQKMIAALNAHISNNLGESQATGVRERFNKFMEETGALLAINGKKIIDFQNVNGAWTIGFDQKVWNSLNNSDLDEHTKIAGIVLNSLKEETSKWEDTGEMDRLSKHLAQL